MASNLSYGPKAVTENLVLCLDANNVKSHSGGTAWYDLSSRANNATLTNGPVFNSSDSTTGGAYFDFDGTNDYATISSPSFAANGFIGGMTCEAWLKFDTASLSGSDTGFITRYQASVQSQFLFGYREAGGQNGLTFYMIADDNSVPGAPFDTDWPPATDVWYHVVGVYRPSGNVSIYVNGGRVFSTTGVSISQLNDDSTLAVMIGNYVSGTYFNGKMAILKMYSKSLSVAEIKQNYNAHRARFKL